MDGVTEVFIETLKRVCIEYDRSNGSYPETEYEGLSIYDFACQLGAGTEISRKKWEDMIWPK